MPYETLGNWGRCNGDKCKMHMAPRCMSDLCEMCCPVGHADWLGHKLPGGKLNQRSQIAADLAKASGMSTDNSLISTALPSALPILAPRVPEPGKFKEVTDELGVFVVVENNSYTYNKDKHLPSGFPLVYVP